MRLWKDNNLEQEYSMPVREIAERFISSNYFDVWQSGARPLATCLCLYIGDGGEGLSSVFELNDPEMLKLYEEVRELTKQLSNSTAA